MSGGYTTFLVFLFARGVYTCSEMWKDVEGMAQPRVSRSEKEGHHGRDAYG
jgi:hypothetical protein